MARTYPAVCRGPSFVVYRKPLHDGILMIGHPGGKFWNKKFGSNLLSTLNLNINQEAIRD